MNIGISLYSEREALWLLGSKFLDLIINDKKNKYIIIYDYPERISNLFIDCKNISLITHYKGNRFKRFLFWYLLYPVDLFDFLLNEDCEDQKFRYQAALHFKKSFVSIGAFFKSVLAFNFVKKVFEYLCYQTSYYDEFEIDRFLITDYHHLKEKFVLYNQSSKEIFYFGSSIDNFSVEGPFNFKINKAFVVDEFMLAVSIKVSKFNQNQVIVTGNPLHEKIQSFAKSLKPKNSILFFANNNEISNEINIVRDLVSNKFIKKIGFNLRLSPSVGGVGAEYKKRAKSYNEILGESNVYSVDPFWHGASLQKGTVNHEYFKQISKHNIIIITGPSNAVYEILASGGIVIMLFIKDINPCKLDWTLSDVRESVNHFKEFDNVYLCYSIQSVEVAIREYLNRENHMNTIISTNNSSQMIFDYIRS